MRLWNAKKRRRADTVAVAATQVKNRRLGRHWTQRKKGSIKPNDFTWWRLIKKPDIRDVHSRNGKVCLPCYLRTSMLFTGIYFITCCRVTCVFPCYLFILLPACMIAVACLPGSETARSACRVTCVPPCYLFILLPAAVLPECLHVICLFYYLRVW